MTNTAQGRPSAVKVVVVPKYNAAASLTVPSTSQTKTASTSANEQVRQMSQSSTTIAPRKETDKENCEIASRKVLKPDDPERFLLRAISYNKHTSRKKNIEWNEDLQSVKDQV